MLTHLHFTDPNGGNCGLSSTRSMRGSGSIASEPQTACCVFCTVHWRRRSTLVITSPVHDYMAVHTRQGQSIVHASVQSLLCSPSIRNRPCYPAHRVTCIGGWGGIPVPLTGGGGCLISGSLSPVAASSSSSLSSSRRQHAQHLQLHGLSVNAWPARSDT
jgi:hypothetical protein